MAFYTPKDLRVVDANDGNRHVDIKVLHGDEWSALYINGELVKAGDTYLIWKELCLLLHITDESIDGTVLFPDGRNPGSLADVRLRQQEANRRKVLAASKEAYAQALLAEAEQLRKGI